MGIFDQWFSRGCDFARPPPGYLVMSGDIFGYHPWEGAIGIKQVEVREAAKYPTMPRAAP